MPFYSVTLSTFEPNQDAMPYIIRWFSINQGEKEVGKGDGQVFSLFITEVWDKNIEWGGWGVLGGFACRNYPSDHIFFFLNPGFAPTLNEQPCCNPDLSPPPTPPPPSLVTFSEIPACAAVCACVNTWIRIRFPAVIIANIPRRIGNLESRRYCHGGREC